MFSRGETFDCPGADDAPPACEYASCAAVKPYPSIPPPSDHDSAELSLEGALE